MTETNEMVQGPCAHLGGLKKESEQTTEESSQSSIFQLLTSLTLKYRSNETGIMYVMKLQQIHLHHKLGHHSSLGCLRNARNVFLTNAPWCPYSDSNGAEIQQKYSGCLDTSSHQITAL